MDKPTKWVEFEIKKQKKRPDKQDTEDELKPESGRCNYTEMLSFQWSSVCCMVQATLLDEILHNNRPCRNLSHMC